MTGTRLIIISDRSALSWVLSEQRMAFPAVRARAAHAISDGDEVLLYSTRGCFGNPTRDAGRILGHATVSSAVRPLAEPVVFGERGFTEGCALTIHGLAPFKEGCACATTCTCSPCSRTRRPGASGCVVPHFCFLPPTPTCSVRNYAPFSSRTTRQWTPTGGQPGHVQLDAVIASSYRRSVLFPTPALTAADERALGEIERMREALRHQVRNTPTKWTEGRRRYLTADRVSGWPRSTSRTSWQESATWR
jgi:hypothetical protein